MGTKSRFYFFHNRRIYHIPMPIGISSREEKMPQKKEMKLLEAISLGRKKGVKYNIQGGGLASDTCMACSSEVTKEGILCE